MFTVGIISPLSLLGCFIDADIEKYIAYTLQLNQQKDEGYAIKYVVKSNKKLKSLYIDINQRNHRSVTRHIIIVRDTDISLRKFKPTDILWYLIHVKNSHRNMHLVKLSRNCFRLPYSSYTKLFLYLKNDSTFL